MSELKIYSEDNPSATRVRTRDHAEIVDILRPRGIRFERWEASKELADDASQEDILGAYQGELDRIMTEGGYVTADVIHMNPDHPEKDAFRKKFLDEHTHSEDEVRFFVRGKGLFTLHLDDEVVEVLCERGDLIGVPANTRHWFDMGPAPHFTAIRVFTNPEGWVANFTGSNIANRFNRLDA